MDVDGDLDLDLALTNRDLDCLSILINAGEHRVAFDGSNVASGVYLYRLTVGDRTLSKKMLLVK